MTPYSFSPTTGVKLVNNPSVDFGQGTLECIDTIYSKTSDISSSILVLGL